MYLKHLHIRHFRSLYDVTLDLKPLTIFIGPMPAENPMSLKHCVFYTMLLRETGWIGRRTTAKLMTFCGMA